jgi:hypothetical protein
LVVGGVVGSFVAPQFGEDGIESLVALLGLEAVALDPLRHEVEDLCLEVARAALRVAGLADEPCIGEDLDVAGDRLHGDVVGLRQLADGGIGHCEAGDHVAPGGVGQGGKHSGQLIIAHVGSLFNEVVEDNVRRAFGLVNESVEYHARV